MTSRKCGLFKPPSPMSHSYVLNLEYLWHKKNNTPSPSLCDIIHEGSLSNPQICSASQSFPHTTHPSFCPFLSTHWPSIHSSFYQPTSIFLWLRFQWSPNFHNLNNIHNFDQINDLTNFSQPAILFFCNFNTYQNSALKHSRNRLNQSCL